MKKEEVEVLGLKKTKEGKSYREIKKEISNVMKTSNGIKLNERLLARKEREIMKLNKKIEKLQDKLFQEGLNKEMEQEKPNKKKVTLSQINKLLSLIKSESKTPKGELRDLVGLTKEQIDRALTFLKRNKLITEISNNGQKLYK